MPADLLAFGLAVALAAEPAGGSVEDAAGPPPVALLEFLGLWTTDDGRWVDPEMLDALPERDVEGGGAGSEAPPDDSPDAGGDGGGTDEKGAEDDHG